MTPACPVCGAGECQPWLRGRDRLFRTTTETFRLVRCRGCGTGRLIPPPTPETLTAAYPPDYWWVTAPPAGVTRRLQQIYRQLVLRHHVRVARQSAPGLGPASRVLDIGCGSGTFLHLLTRHTGAQTEGLEADPAAAAAVSERYGLTVHAGPVLDFTPSSGPYDLITLFHVLEHLPDPHAALARVRRWLTPDGVLLAQVPNADSLQARLLGARWTGFDFPRHLLAFPPAALARLLARAGFRPGPPRFHSWRDDAPALISSVWPGLDPVAVRMRHLRLAFLRNLLYFLLLLPAWPLTWLEARVGRGGTVFIAARPDPAAKLEA